MNELTNLIDAYFQHTLSSEEEQYLFTVLSSNAEGRNYFKERQLCSSALQAVLEPYPSALDDAVFSAIQKKQKSSLIQQFVQPGYLAAAAVFSTFIIALVLLLGRVEAYKSQVDNAMVEIKNQHQTIELLMNGLPTVQVTANGANKVYMTNN